MARSPSAAVISLLGLFLVVPGAGSETPPVGYRPFPSGFDHPATDETIGGWVDDGRWTRIREHGWSLFVGMRGTEPTSPQIWETWFSQPAAFRIGPTLVASRRAPGQPTRRTLHNKHVAALGSGGIGGAPRYVSTCEFGGTEFVNNGDIMIAGVYYNLEAYRHIRDRGYEQTGVLQAARERGDGSIAPFPASSFSIKHVYWPVRQDGLTALPVSPHYNPAPDPADPGAPVIPPDPTAYNGYETWTDAVAIAPSEALRVAAGETAGVTYLYIDDPSYPPVTFPAAEVVPIDRFYFRQVGDVEWSGMSAVDQCILNQSARWTYGREFRPGDFIVSVAMHISTKEFPPWTMQSFWWSPEPERGRYGEGRPTTLPAGVWNNYMMCTAYDMERPLEGDGTPAVCSNPYIELVIPERYRSVTNCQNCHARGAFPAAKVLTNTITQDAHYDPERRGAIPFDDPIFRGLVATDFSWAIPLSTTPHPDE